MSFVALVIIWVFAAAYMKGEFASEPTETAMPEQESQQ